MTLDELKELVEHGLIQEITKGEQPRRLCVNQNTADQIGSSFFMGLTVKVVAALPDGKVLLE